MERSISVERKDKLCSGIMVRFQESVTSLSTTLHSYYNLCYNNAQLANV